MFSKHTAIATTLVVAFFASAQAQTAKSCQALVLSGGANKGAYEAGVIYGLTHLLKEDQVRWDVVSGVSTGALTGGGVSVWPPEKPVEMSEWLTNMWLNMTQDNVFKLWDGGFQEGLYNQSGIVNDQPLVDFVDKILTDAGSIKRKIVVGTVDVNTGNYVTFDERSAPIDQMARRVVSSASIPFVFPHQLIDNMTLMDGGTVWNINMVSAIERCREQVDDDSQITVDVISCARDFKSNDSFSANSIGNWLKYRAIKSFNSGMRNVYETQLAYPKVNYRYFFQASEPLTSGFQELEFGPEILGPMIELGKKDAATVVGLGEGALFEKVNTWVQKKNKNEQVPNLEAFLYE